MDIPETQKGNENIEKTSPGPLGKNNDDCAEKDVKKKDKEGVGGKKSGGDEEKEGFEETCMLIVV